MSAIAVQKNLNNSTTIEVIGGAKLVLQKTRKGWWGDQGKVLKLLEAFSYDFSVKDACSYAQITLAQYYYFTSFHPEMEEIRKALITHLIMRAKQTVAEKIGTRFSFALKYPSIRRPEEYGPTCRSCKSLMKRSGEPKSSPSTSKGNEIQFVEG